MTLFNSIYDEDQRPQQISQHPCELLPWDSQFFGKKIALVTKSGVNQEAFNSIETWSANHSIDCLYFLVRPSQLETITLAQENGFKFMGIRVTLEKDLSDFDPGFSDSRIRSAVPEDKVSLEKLARTLHLETRFTLDKNFPEKAREDFYSEWMRKSCSGLADKIFVVEDEGKAIGYVTCHLDLPKKQGRFGLVGIGDTYQGQGLGGALIHEALKWFWEQKVHKVGTVTLGRNQSAMALYQKCGFQLAALELWYHKWRNLSA